MLYSHLIRSTPSPLCILCTCEYLCMAVRLCAYLYFSRLRDAFVCAPLSPYGLLSPLCCLVRAVRCRLSPMVLPLSWLAVAVSYVSVRWLLNVVPRKVVCVIVVWSVWVWLYQSDLSRSVPDFHPYIHSLSASVVSFCLLLHSNCSRRWSTDFTKIIHDFGGNNDRLGVAN